MKKNLFFRLCLIFMVSVTAYSCRTDQFPEQETYNNSAKFQLTSKRISLDEAKHKTQLITELSEAKNDFKKLSKSNAKGKTVNFGDSISVNTDNVIYMENGPDYHTYTFSIQRNNPLSDAAVENLVLTPLPDGGYKAYLVTYNLTEAEKNTIINGGNVEVNNKSVVTPLEGNFSSILGRIECSEYIYDYYTWCGEGLHNDGKPCKSKDGVYSQYVVVIGVKCNGGNPMLPVTNPVDSGSGSGEEGGATPSNPCSVNGVYTNPQDPSNSDCNGGVVTLPNIEDPNISKSDCERLKEKTDDPIFKAKLDSISSRVTNYGDQHETNISVTKYKGKITYKVTAGTADVLADGTKIVKSQGTNVDIANMHNHASDGIPIFSYKDIVLLYNQYNFLVAPRKNEYVEFLAPSNGMIYALRVQDLSNLATLFAGIDTWSEEGRKEAEKKILDIYKNEAGMDLKLDYTADMAEKLFLNVMKSDKVGSDSIYLYQYEDGVWKKLKLNANGSVNKDEICPQF